MQRDDYLMRMIRELGVFVRGVKQLVATRQEQAALDMIEQALRQLLGVPSDATFTIRDVSADVSIGPLTPWERDRRVALATLLREAGDIYTRQDRDNLAYAAYLQALNLLLDVIHDAPDSTLPPSTPTIAELDTALRPYNLPLNTGRALIDYYEQAGAFANAEDTLFALRLAEPNNVELAQLGRAFYARLLRRSDDELIAGNLPRDEVEAGLAEFE